MNKNWNNHDQKLIKAVRSCFQDEINFFENTELSEFQKEELNIILLLKEEFETELKEGIIRSDLVNQTNLYYKLY